MRMRCPALTILSVLGTFYNSVHRVSESNVSSQGSALFKRTDSDIERGVKSMQFK